MKNLVFFIALSLVFLSCKKEKQPDIPVVTDNPSNSDDPSNETTIAKGEYLIIAVSDSVEYANEYHMNSASELTEIPMNISHKMVFINNQTYYRKEIHAYGINLILGILCDSLITPLDFPYFTAQSGNFIESVVGNELERGEAYSLELDPLKVVSYSSPNETVLENSWSKIKNLRIVHEYRTLFPDSKIAFLYLKKQNGEAKSYFFMNKYKP